MKEKKPFALLILEAWGVSPNSQENPFNLAKISNFDRFVKEYPVMTLYASGKEVGLCDEKIGNSISGHLNIGTGRIFPDNISRINRAIADESLFEKRVLKSAIEHVEENNSTLHITAAFDNNHYARFNHFEAILKFLQKQKVKKVSIHVVLDSEAGKEENAKKSIKKIINKLKVKKNWKISSISGSFYALNDGFWWDRIESVYRAMTESEYERSLPKPMHIMHEAVEKKIPAKEIVPARVEEGETIKSGDALIFLNHSPAGSRQLLESFVLPSFNKFSRSYLKDLFCATIVEYEREMPVRVIFPPLVSHNCLGRVLQENELSQYRIASVGRYGSISTFFDGFASWEKESIETDYVNDPELEDYNLEPGLSLNKLIKKIIRRIDNMESDFFLINISNLDILAKTNNFSTLVRGVELVDKAIGKIYDHIMAKEGTMFIVGSHPGTENFFNDGKMIEKSNAVPFIILNEESRGRAGITGDAPEGDLSLLQPAGVLADVAPTILKILDIKKPDEMTGRALV
ncbi:MAG: phosphoglycerate mutase (2,3-diphosphoglycerate-independent) [Candidatus Magasanikbacteria bacterium]|nr:phosphoglycerate mutase (2,3-diphosphoglycerate-independent) [Candidatus Magasanikbacteria bacterium]